MEKVYIFGHTNPDTDSVASAVCLEYLKHKQGYKAVASVLGEVNSETKFVFKYFDTPLPKYLNDVKLQIKDLNYHKDCYLNSKTSLEETYNYMNMNNITGVPIVDDDFKFLGIITAKNLLNSIFYSDNTLNTSYNNILKTLNAKEVIRFNDEIVGKIMVSSYRSTTFNTNIELSTNDILIVGDRHSIIEQAINSKVKLIIITGDGEIKEEHLLIAKNNKVNIIRTQLDTFMTTRKIELSNYIINYVSSNRPYLAMESEYYDTFMENVSRLKFNNYPVIDKNNICKGLIRLTEITSKNKKKVILVDHNESSQSVVGLDEAEILEIIDHHKIGDISTSNPINFRNMAVGSTNTIIYFLYKENRVEIPYNIAGLMMSGILSDTLMLTSPTTTIKDKEAIIDLQKICKIDYKKFAKLMFSEASNLENKTISEVLKMDNKVFTYNDLKFSISQAITMDNKILDKKDEYINELEQICINEKYDFMIFSITDIINKGSYFLYTKSATNYLLRAFDLEEIYEGIFINGCLSRKKQIVPKIMEVI